MGNLRHTLAAGTYWVVSGVFAGYYPPGQLNKSNRQAQIDMIEESLRWAGVENVSKMVDVGCGIGGSSRHIVRMFEGCTANGVTLSPYQACWRPPTQDPLPRSPCSVLLLLPGVAEPVFTSRPREQTRSARQRG